MNPTLPHEELGPKELNLKRKNVWPSTNSYKYIQVPAWNNPNVTLDTSQQTVQFKIPTNSNAINLPKTYLRFDLEIPAPGANRHTWIWADFVSAIRDIRLTSSNGEIIAEIKEANHYLAGILPAETSIKELQSLPVTQVSNHGMTEAIQPAYVASQKLMNGNVTGQSLIEPRATIVSDANSAYTIKFYIPLGAFKNTHLDYPKDLWYPDTLNLDVSFDIRSKVAFYATANNNPSTGTSAFPANINVNNLFLYVAVNTNPEVVEDLQKLVLTKGLDLKIPYVLYQTQNRQTSQHQFQFFISKNSGKKLLKIYWIPFNNVASSATAYLKYDHSSLAVSATFGTDYGAKVTRFTTNFGGRTLQEKPIEISKYEDYLAMKGHLEESTVHNLKYYAYKWFWCENYTSHKLWENISDLNVGLPITEDLVYDVDATVSTSADALSNGGNLKHYIYCVVMRDLHIGKDGVYWN